MSEASSFSVRPLARPDSEAVRRIWTSRFGGEPSTQQNWIDAALDPAHTALGLVAVASRTGTIVGTSFLDVGSREYTRRYLGLDALDLELSLAGRNGLFHLSCVQADWEGCGIGSVFYERRLEVLADRDVPRAFGIAWHRPAVPVDSRVLFEKYDFTCFATVERFYSRTGTRPTCPVCPDTCRCTVSLYGRSVQSALI